MAFMMPVVKNDWDIYKSNRSRKTSETSSVAGSPATTTASTRSRKISESRSEGKGSFTSSRFEGAFTKHHSVPDRMSSKLYNRQRTTSDTLPNRAKASTPTEKTATTNNLKTNLSWLEKLKKFMKSRSEEERTQS